MARTLATMLAALLLLAACGDGGSDSLIERRAGEPDVHLVRTEDPAMLAAFDEARRTLPAVMARLAELQAEGVYVSVKVPVASGDKVEHIWLSDLRYEEDRVFGRLGNEPVDLPGWSLGDPIDMAADEISDWMLVRGDGRLVGGYTIFALRDKLSGDERRSFEAQVGLVMPETPRSLDD